MAHVVLACLNRLSEPPVRAVCPSGSSVRLVRAACRPGELIRPTAGPHENEYAYSGAAPPRPRSMETMLWSDPRDEPPKEMRATLAMLRRLCWLLPFVVIVSVVLANVRPDA